MSFIQGPDERQKSRDREVPVIHNHESGGKFYDYTA